MNRAELFKRTSAILDPEVARRETILSVGCGSLGSRVAEEAARFGVGALILVDRPGERLEEHNIIRHPLGYSSLGRGKGEALRDRLLDINPECRVETVETDVTQNRDTLSGLLRDATLAVVTTDNEPSRHAVNQAAVALGVPLVHAGVFDGGCGGNAGRVLPGRACYACVAAQLRISLPMPSPDAPAPVDYSRMPDEHPPTAALNIDIAQIALVAARIILLHIQAKHQRDLDWEGNYILFGNRAVPDVFPRMLHSDIWDIPRLDGCLVCAPDIRSPEVYQRLASEILRGARC